MVTPSRGIDDDGNGYIDDVHGWDFADGDADPSDDDGHGMHGTIPREQVVLKRKSLCTVLMFT